MTREERGELIANRSRQITHITDVSYTVKSQTTKTVYAVVCTGDKWSCTCPDHVYREITCKHIHAVQSALYDSRPLIETCTSCQSGMTVRKGRRGAMQRHKCKKCNRYFSCHK